MAEDYFWQAVDHEVETLDGVNTKTPGKNAALKPLTKAMRKPSPPATLVTHRLRSYGAALRDPGVANSKETGHRLIRPAARTCFADR
ncbi:MAG: DDE-type integrase/transposase/recombinase [Proteobacteria bacterium]|nr:DDE-type integrase/transposase/recombinase [Pseudomonadota bacterium]